MLKSKKAFLTGILCVCIACGWICEAIIEIAAKTVIMHIIECGIIALFFGFFGIVAFFLSSELKHRGE